MTRLPGSHSNLFDVTPPQDAEDAYQPESGEPERPGTHGNLFSPAAQESPHTGLFDPPAGDDAAPHKDLTRPAPNLRAFLVGEGIDKPISAEAALRQGHVRKYVDSLRQHMESLPEGSQERLDIARGMAPMVQNLSRWESEVERAKARGVSVQALRRMESTILGLQRGELEKQITSPRALLETVTDKPTAENAFRGGILNPLNYAESAGAVARHTATALSGAAGTVQSLADRVDTRALRAEPTGMGFLASGLMDLLRREGIGADVKQIAADKDIQQQITQAIDRDTGLKRDLGPLYEPITAAIQSVPVSAGIAATGGLPLLYTWTYGQSLDDSLNYADANDIQGLQRTAFANGMAAFETGITALVGRFGKAAGFDTMEEAFLPAARRAATKQLERVGFRQVLAELAKKAAGATSEGAEESIINVGQQSLENAIGVRPDWDPIETLKTFAGGLFGGVAAGGGASLASKYEAVTSKAGELYKGIHDAQALARPHIAERLKGIDDVDFRPLTETPAEEETETAEEGAPVLSTEETALSPNVTYERTIEFAENLTPEDVARLQEDDLSAEDFEQITGIPNTTEGYRDGFIATIETHADEITEMASQPVEAVESLEEAPASVISEETAAIEEGGPVTQALVDLSMTPPELLGRQAFHGSPFEGIEKFSTEKIGTGEGAAAFGWGLYFTDSPKIAEHYRKALGREKNLDDYTKLWSAIEKDHPELADDVEAFVDAISMDYNDVVLGEVVAGIARGRRKFGPDVLEDDDPMVQAIKEQAPLDLLPERGQTYTVRLKPQDQELLDWSKPFGEQSEQVQAAARELLGDEVDESGSGAGAYQQIVSATGSKKAASLALRDAGVKGIKYPAGTISGVKSKASNYVIFDDKDVEIEGAPSEQERQDLRDLFHDILAFEPQSPSPPEFVDRGYNEPTPEAARQHYERDRKRFRDITERLDAASRETTALREIMDAQRDEDFETSDVEEATRIVMDNVDEGPQKTRLLKGLLEAEDVFDLDEVLESTLFVLRQQDKKAAIGEFDNAVKFAKNLRAEFAELVEDIRGGIDTGSKKSRKRLKAMSAYFDENPDVPIPEHARKALDRLQKTHITEMEPNEIRSATDAILSAVHQSQVHNNFMALEHGGFIADSVEAASQELAAATPLAQREVEVQGRKEKRREIFDLTDSPLAVEGLTRVEDILTDSPTLQAVIWEGLAVNGRANHLDWTKEATQQASEVLLQQGLDWEATTVAGYVMPDLRSIEGDIQVQALPPLESFRRESRGWNGHDITRAEALFLHLQLQDQETRGLMRLHGFNWRGREFDPVTDGAEAELNEFVGAQGHAFNGWAFEHFNGPLIERVNAENERVLGYPMTRRQQHVPRPTKRAIKWSKDDPLGMTQQFAEATHESYGHLKARGHEQGAITFPDHVTDGIDFVMDHINNMNRYAAYLAPFRDARMVLSAMEKQLKDYGGEGLYDGLQRAAHRQVGGVPRPTPKAERRVATVLRRVMGSAVGLSVGAHVLGAIGILTSAARYANGTKYFGKAMVDWANPKKSREAQKLIRDNSSMYWQRYEKGDYLGEWSNGMFTTETGHFRPRPLSDALTRSLGRSEFFWSTPKVFIAREALRDQLGREPSDMEVVREWERLMLRSENTSEGLEYTGMLAWAAEQGVYTRAGATFLNAASKQMSLATRGARELRRGNRQRGAQMLSYATAGIALEAALRMLTSQEDVPGGPIARLLKRGALGFVTSIPFVGPIMGVGLRNMMGMRNWFGESNILVDAATDIAYQSGKFADQHAKFIFNLEGYDQDKHIEALKELSSAAPGLAGVPTRNAERLGTLIGGGFPGLQRGDDKPTFKGASFKFEQASGAQ